LGRHTLNLLQLIARKHKMSVVQVVVPEGCDAMESLLLDRTGFVEDEMEYASAEDLEDGLEGLTIFHKVFAPLPSALAPLK
jgi:hypothetical protein